MTAQSDERPQVTIDLSAYKSLFLEQAAEFLSLLRQSLAQLTNDPTDATARKEAYRAAHTLKGMSSTMHYDDLATVAKRLEGSLKVDMTLSSEQLRVALADCDTFEAGLKPLNPEHEA